MEWELNPSTWDLSQMELQDTAFGVSHHQGGVDGESATIFSVDLRLGSGLGLGIDDHYDNNNSSSNNNNSCNAGGSCHGVPIMGADTPNRSSTSSRTEAPFSSKRGRGRAGGASDISRQNLSCLVDGCTSELSDSREYHRRHRVCEQHAKTPVVLIGGHQRRFCQQCSRFHSLGEFDDTKRSCRKRLYVHNRRRRKSFLPGNSGSGSLEFKTTSQYGSAAGATLNGGMNWPMVSPAEMPPPFTYSGHRYGTQLQPPVADRPTSPYPASSYWGGRYDYEIGSMSHQGMVRSDYAPSLLSPAASGGPSLVQQAAVYYSIMQSHETASSSLSSAQHLGESGSHGGSFP